MATTTKARPQSNGSSGASTKTNTAQAKDNQQLIIKYRGVAAHPEVDAAIEDIVNESIVGSEIGVSCELNLDDVDAPDNIKKTMIRCKFDIIF